MSKAVVPTVTATKVTLVAEGTEEVNNKKVKATMEVWADSIATTIDN
jgi:hypothetical protein